MTEFLSYDVYTCMYILGNRSNNLERVKWIIDLARIRQHGAQYNFRNR